MRWIEVDGAADVAPFHFARFPHHSAAYSPRAGVDLCLRTNLATQMATDFEVRAMRLCPTQQQQCRRQTFSRAGY